jgi:hypothetical protein
LVAPLDYLKLSGTELYNFKKATQSTPQLSAAMYLGLLTALTFGLGMVLKPIIEMDKILWLFTAFGAGGFRSNDLERLQDSIPWAKGGVSKL